jgi:hypothetical protein
MASLWMEMLPRANTTVVHYVRQGDASQRIANVLSEHRIKSHCTTALPPTNQEIDMEKFAMKYAMCFAAVITFALCGSSALAANSKLDTAMIEQITGMKGNYNQKENVFKVSMPRADVQVVVDGWKMPPFMGLGPWAAFTPHHSGAMVMGDMVLFQDEVNPAMSAALDSGLAVTALHNHFFFDEPKVYFMHIGGEGTVAKLATGVKAVFDKVKEIRASNPQPMSAFPGERIPEKSTISAEPLQSILGSEGQVNNGMFKVVLGRSTKMNGTTAGNEMGVNTWAAFAGSDDNAVVDGDFAMLEGELQAVLKSMRKGGINIVAIHHHMSEERPKFLFLHYWGRGKADDLAHTLRATLDEQSKPQRAGKMHKE